MEDCRLLLLLLFPPYSSGFMLLSLYLAVEAFKANGGYNVPNSAREKRSGN